MRIGYIEVEFEGELSNQSKIVWIEVSGQMYLVGRKCY